MRRTLILPTGFQIKNARYLKYLKAIMLFVLIPKGRTDIYKLAFSASVSHIPILYTHDSSCFFFLHINMLIKE